SSGRPVAIPEGTGLRRGGSPTPTALRKAPWRASRPGRHTRRWQARKRGATPAAAPGTPPYGAPPIADGGDEENRRGVADPAKSSHQSCKIIAPLCRRCADGRDLIH